MDDKLEKAQDILLEKVNNICKSYALNNVMAQLYAVLYLNNKPLSLDEMAKRLKISKGSVSVNIRALERYGAVAKVWVKGSRKDYYKTEGSISKVIMERIKSMGEKRLSEFNDMINSCYAILDSVSFNDEENRLEIKLFRQKLEELKKLYNKAKTLFSLLNSNLLSNALNSGGHKKETFLSKIFNISSQI